MSKQPEPRDLRQRFEEFAARFAERTRSRGPHQPVGSPAPALDEDYWQTVQDLFTRDVTGKGVRELLEHETRDTFHFFTRGIDFAALRPKPWYRRYPVAAWKVFLAMAYRLSPPRRIMFALAVPLLWLGWLRYVLAAIGVSSGVPESFTWLVLAATLFFALLVLELRDKLALKGDLEIARQIQFGLLPFEPYDESGLAVRAAMRPANTVGGDYFDLIELGEGRLAVVIGDVAGKGMPAALLMALLQGSLRTLVTAGLRGADLLLKLNAHLHANIPSNRLITLFYAEIDPGSGEVRYVNAGHNSPFVLRRDGTIERLPATAVALGVMADAGFKVDAIRLDPGERLFLFTDGITEAFDPREAEYGEERLERFLSGRRWAPPEELLAALVADVVSFCGSAPPRDDMTLMVIERSGSPRASTSSAPA